MESLLSYSLSCPQYQDSCGAKMAGAVSCGFCSGSQCFLRGRACFPLSLLKQSSSIMGLFISSPVLELVQNKSLVLTLKAKICSWRLWIQWSQSPLVPPPSLPAPSTPPVHLPHPGMPPPCTPHFSTQLSATLLSSSCRELALDWH